MVFSIFIRSIRVDLLFLGSRKIQGMVWFVDTTPYCIYNYSMHEFDYHRHCQWDCFLKFLESQW